MDTEAAFAFAGALIGGLILGAVIGVAFSYKEPPAQVSTVGAALNEKHIIELDTVRLFERMTGEHLTLVEEISTNQVLTTNRWWVSNATPPTWVFITTDHPTPTIHLRKEPKR